MKSTTPREPRKVTIIPATPKSIEPGKTSHHKLRVAAYCRVSTDSEEQINSYKNQCPLPAKIDRKKVKKTE